MYNQGERRFWILYSIDKTEFLAQEPSESI